MIAYLAHPVGHPSRGGVLDNLANARAWLAFLIRHTDAAVLAPWMPYVEALDDAVPRDRARGMRDGEEFIRRARPEVIVVVGAWSSGIGSDVRVAREVGAILADLTPFGREPPDDDGRIGFVRLALSRAAVPLLDVRG